MKQSYKQLKVYDRNFKINFNEKFNTSYVTHCVLLGSVLPSVNIQCKMILI